MNTSGIKARFLTGLLLAGSNTAAGTAASATELNIWVMSTTAQQQQDMKELLHPYLAGNPSLRVNVTVLNWESAWSKITAASASGQGPDILELGTTWVAAISSMNALEPISLQQQTQMGSAKAFIPAVWGTTHRFDDSTVYAIPWYADARTAFYRTDVFKKAGVNPKEAFTNWTSFKQAMQKINGQVINGKKIYALGYPGKNDWKFLHVLAPWVPSGRWRCDRCVGAAGLAGADAGLVEELNDYALACLNWIFGFNPFDVCMMQGHGRNNPRYEPGF